MTLYAVSIDTEEQWDWNAGWPVRSYSLDNIRVLTRFQELCAKHGAMTTWFTDWTVMNDAPSRTIMLDIAARQGTELAMHIHPWLTPPYGEGSESTRTSYLHTHPASVIRDKLSNVLGLFTDAGLRPRSFRGGRYSSGGAIHEFLLANEFVADSSVVPFTSWAEDGAPDYRHRDCAPRRVGSTPNGSGFWEIPLSLAFTRPDFRAWARRFERIEHSALRHVRLIGILGAIGFVRRTWLNFETTAAAEMLALLRLLRALQMPAVVLTVHSSSLVAGGNPYAAHESAVRRIWQTVDQVLSTLHSWSDFRPATMSAIADALESSHSGNSR